ncbi:MAG TPA: response regulator [Blastocatellia bacterium]|nr:response regulator [Blastocatellia bacterium]
MVEKILVVDDSDDTREMMARLLELESFTVITAEDGDAGIYRARSERPDLIITDINMPNINGIEMIRLLRNEADFSRVPIMAITAYGNSVAAEAIEAGADQAMTKPVEFESLIDDIKKLLIKARFKGLPLS